MMYERGLEKIKLPLWFLHFATNALNFKLRQSIHQSVVNLPLNIKKLSKLLTILIHQSIHQSVVNLPVNIAEEEDEELRTMLAQLEYGNKISILGWAKNTKKSWALG